MKKLFLTFLFWCGMAASLSAQKFAVAYNVGDLATLCSFSAEVDYAVGRKWTLNLGGRFNPWIYNKDDEFLQTQMRHQTYSFGARYWPWYVYSGLWMGAKAQFQEYSFGGFDNKLRTEEGYAYGVGVELGYCLMLNHNWNINFGFGGWGGAKNYTAYSCSFCGRQTESGWKGFFWPNELMIAVMYVF